jgi:hypothetical protein
MGDMVTVCDRENPDSLKERIFYKLGTPIFVVFRFKGK